MDIVTLRNVERRSHRRLNEQRLCWRSRHVEEHSNGCGRSKTDVHCLARKEEVQVRWTSQCEALHTYPVEFVGDAPAPFIGKTGVCNAVYRGPFGDRRLDDKTLIGLGDK